jgi:hypothetical protein
MRIGCRRCRLQTRPMTKTELEPDDWRLSRHQTYDGSTWHHRSYFSGVPLGTTITVPSAGPRSTYLAARPRKAKMFEPRVGQARTSTSGFVTVASRISEIDSIGKCAPHYLRITLTHLPKRADRMITGDPRLARSARHAPADQARSPRAHPGR